MQTVKMINFILMCLFFACYMYQFLYIPVSWLPRKRRAREAPLHRFAVLIAACNEETVIGNLLDSIKAQSYPERFLKVFVVADNCRDKTAETARAHGAEVYERQNASLRGKGYALDFLLREMERYAHNEFDGYIVLDADNVLERDFKIASAVGISTGPVILMFSGEPLERWTFTPIASTAAQSSVYSFFSAIARVRAALMISGTNACGVWMAASALRFSVRTTVS